MNKMILTAALVTMIASPALAQRAQPAERIVNPQATQTTPYGRTEAVRKHSVNPAYDVYESGQYIGSDPDVRIRQDLQRDRVSD